MPESSANPSPFLTTRWTVVQAATRENDPQAIDAFGALFESYWPPLYRYARRRGKSREDAEDLVQGFFHHLMESRALDKTARERGRFRTFLLTAFQNWMTNDWKHGARLKRGGGMPPVSFDWAHAESGLTFAADVRSPDQLYDREWAISLLDRVLAALETMATAEGHADQFAVLKPCLTADSNRIAYPEMAARLGLGEGAARVAVHRLRKRYRQLLIDEISRTLPTPESVDEELRALFAALA